MPSLLAPAMQAISLAVVLPIQDRATAKHTGIAQKRSRTSRSFALNDHSYPGSIGQVPSRLRIVDDFLCQPHPKSHHISSFHLTYIQFGVHAENRNTVLLQAINSLHIINIWEIIKQAR